MQNYITYSKKMHLSHRMFGITCFLPLDVAQDQHGLWREGLSTIRLPTDLLLCLPPLARFTSWKETGFSLLSSSLLYSSAKAAITEVHILDGLGIRNVFDASSRSRSWQGWFLVRPLSLACRWLPSHSVLTWTFPLYAPIPGVTPLFIKMSILLD